MCGRNQYTLIKSVEVYPLVVVKKYRYLVLILCLLYVILKLYYSVTPSSSDILNENVSEIQTVNSFFERRLIKSASVISVTKKQIVKNTSAFSEKQRVTYIYNNNFGEKQTVNNINVNSVDEKQKVTNVSSVNDDQTARISKISDTKRPSIVKIASVTEELSNIITNNKGVTNKVPDKQPAKVEVVQKSKVKNNVYKKPVQKAKSKIFDVSCHYSTQNDTLSSVDDPNFSPRDQPIFFHETSCRGGINNRQACAIESAARLHPKRQINLLFSAPVTESGLNNSNLVHLLKIGNINILRLHVEQYTNGTIVDSLFKTKIKKSSYPVEHIADILRIVTLHKYGGVYLDTDSFLVKNLDSLPPNWIAEELNNTLSSGAMGFSIDDFGYNLTTEILKEIRNTYNPKSWSSNGPKAIQRVLQRICPKTVKTTGDCKGLKIFPSKDFYPVHYKQHAKYFEKGKMPNMYQSYMHHMWNHLTMNKKIEKDSPYANLAEKLCPTIFATYGKEFGQ